MKYNNYLYFLLSLTLLLFACNTNEQQDKKSGNTPFVQKNIKEAVFKNNRIFINVKTDRGKTIKFFTDTGGGKIIYPETVEQLGLDIETIKDGEQVYEAVDLSELFRQKGLPVPIGKHFIYREDRQFMKDSGGMLGASWFADKIWNFDYQNQQVHTLESINWDKMDKNNTLSLGFKKNAKGKNSTHFPRIAINVEGETIQTLFDTGATAYLNEAGKAKLNGQDIVGTSFIVASIFDKWRKEHPDWEFIEKGDDLIKEDMIQVPVVKIGDHEVGPVWFSRRADKNFTQYMSQWMDETIHGAIGGSCLQYFSTVLIDYNKSLAYFEK